MDLNDKIARTKRAVLNCEKKPDYLIYINDSELTYDMQELNGIKVIHIDANVSYIPWGDSGLPFIPAWNNEGDSLKYTLHFERTYNNN